MLRKLNLSGFGARIWALIGFAIFGSLALALVSLGALRESMLAEKRLATKHVVEVARDVVAGFHAQVASGALQDAAAGRVPVPPSPPRPAPDARSRSRCCTF